MSCLRVHLEKDQGTAQKWSDNWNRPSFKFDNCSVQLANWFDQVVPEVEGSALLLMKGEHGQQSPFILVGSEH